MYKFLYIYKVIKHSSYIRGTVYSYEIPVVYIYSIYISYIYTGIDNRDTERRRALYFLDIVAILLVYEVASSNILVIYCISILYMLRAVLFSCLLRAIHCCQPFGNTYCRLKSPTQCVGILRSFLESTGTARSTPSRKHTCIKFK